MLQGCVYLCGKVKNVFQTAIIYYINKEKEYVS
ncbi:hypothetical protein IMSAGC004_02842 [Bacteroidaceae bacterium]|nr:hypothetical protein IMSAGC004_02842 [Bacteroidaceae bacterium]